MMVCPEYRKVYDTGYTALIQQFSFVEQTMNSMSTTIAELIQTIKEMKEQLNKNSKNSSQPPSSDRLKKLPVKKDKSLRRSSRKKQGGQDGHAGKYLTVTSNPDLQSFVVVLNTESGRIRSMEGAQ
jgi:uncharacterized coiled-coil protein SlyX